MTAENTKPGNLTPSNLSEKIQSLRKKLGLNQGELADRAGINRSYLSQVENGHSSPTMEVVERIAQGLGVSIWTLLGGSDEKHFTYDTDDVFESYQGLTDFLSDTDEMLLIQPTTEEVDALKGIRFSGNFRPDKRFYRDALLAYRRRSKSNSSKGYPDSTT